MKKEKTAIVCLIRKTLISAMILICSLPVFGEATFLKLSQGTSALNWRGGFYSSWLNSKRADLSLDVSARYQYYFINNFALDVELSSKTTFIQAVRESVAVNLGLTYVFNTNSLVYPYLGVLGGMSYLVVGTKNVPFAQVKPEVGILVAVAENWALDFGVRGGVYFGVFLPEDIGLNQYEVGAGYVGVNWFI